LSTGPTLGIDLLPPTVREPHAPERNSPDLPANGVSFKEAVAAFERQLIIRALRNESGVQKRAAESLKVKPTTLHEMMKRLQISTESLDI
jgi:two-component system response regulator PilR (NtrC family)